MKTAASSDSSIVVPGHVWWIVGAVALLHFASATALRLGLPDVWKPRQSEITIELGGKVLRGDGGEQVRGQGSITSREAPAKTLPLDETGQRQVSERSNAKVLAPTAASTESSAAAGFQASPSVDADYKAAYLNNPKPPYPSLAFQMRIEGTVRLKALVLPDGSCGEVLLAESSGNDLLDRSAMNTVRQWKFVPAKSQGKDVSQWVSIPITFALKRR